MKKLIVIIILFMISFAANAQDVFIFNVTGVSYSINQSEFNKIKKVDMTFIWDTETSVITIDSKKRQTYHYTKLYSKYFDDHSEMTGRARDEDNQIVDITYYSYTNGLILFLIEYSDAALLYNLEP